VLQAADIIQPWAVGSYGDLEGVTRNAEQKWVPDMEWCKAHGREYMPVIFPGFSGTISNRAQSSTRSPV